MGVYLYTNRKDYEIANIPTTDTNVYVNVAQSGYTIQSVKFKFTATSDWAYVHISWNNSNSNRYWICCGKNTSNVSADLCAIRGRLNWASDTYYRTVSYSRSGTNQIEFYINRDGNCYITVNWTKTTYTAGTAELNIIQTIMNLSNMNVYASQNGACLTWNKVDVEVTYS